jgi:hydroxyacylglutathione hydrolase
MHFHQVLNDELGCASYLLADGGEAVVVDPRWDVEAYLNLAERAGARITHVVDTHDHADHVSGRGRLQRLTGAAVHRPGAGLSAGAELRAGQVRLTALSTPGHRPEHFALVVVDEARGPAPWCVLSGDSLLVGDVARPDLAVEARAGAAALHASIQRLFELGDQVEVWPAHVGGSLCGGGRLSPKTSSTIGYERRSSSPAALGAEDFVDAVCATSPPKPPHLEIVVARNQGALDDEPEAPALLDADGLRSALAAGATVLDARAAADYDAGHVGGALNVPPGASRVTRVGWAVDPQEPLVVIDDDVEGARRFAGALHAIGLWRVVGVAAADPGGWSAAGLAVRTGAAWAVALLAEALRERRVALVDVRDEAEWAAGHVPGSIALPLHSLRSGRAPVAGLNGGPIAVACAGGGRAALGASLLRRAGHTDVVRVAGGGIADLASLGIELARC